MVLVRMLDRDVCLWLVYCLFERLSGSMSDAQAAFSNALSAFPDVTEDRLLIWHQYGTPLALPMKQRLAQPNILSSQIGVITAGSQCLWSSGCFIAVFIRCKCAAYSAPSAPANSPSTR